MTTTLLLFLGLLNTQPEAPAFTTTEEIGFSAQLLHSSTYMMVLAVGADQKSVPCKQGQVIDWAAYQYQTPNGFDGYSPADRWRCVKATDYDTARKAKHYSPPRLNPPLPAAAETGVYSNLDAETYKKFKKRLAGAGGQNGFAWKVSDKLVLTYSAGANRPGSYKPDNPEDDRPTWSVRLNEFAFREKDRPTSVQKSDHALYAEPKVRFFQQGPKQDLFIISSKDVNGANVYFLWRIDYEKGTSWIDIRKDTLTLDKFNRCEYILDKGVLWELCEERLIRGQRNRIFNYHKFEKGSFNLWRDGMPGPKPPLTTFPPAKTE